MKTSEIKYANAFAVTTAFVWVVCTLGVALLPSASFMMSGWFMHGLNMSALGVWKVTMGGFLWGGIVLSGIAWAAGYIFGLVLKK